LPTELGPATSRHGDDGSVRLRSRLRRAGGNAVGTRHFALNQVMSLTSTKRAKSLPRLDSGAADPDASCWIHASFRWRPKRLDGRNTDVEATSVACSSSGLSKTPTSPRGDTSTAIAQRKKT